LGWAQKKTGKGHSCIWHCTFSLEHGGAGKKTPQKEKEKKKKTFAPLPGNWIVLELQIFTGAFVACCRFVFDWYTF
jgi:hypothetical protein